MVAGGLQVKVPELFAQINMQLKWVGERGASQSNIYLNNDVYYSLPPYFTADLMLASFGLYLLNPYAETKIYASIVNLLDERHSEPGFGGLDVPTLGRQFWVGIQQSF